VLVVGLGAVVVAATAAAVWWVAAAHRPAPASPLLGVHLPDQGFTHVLPGTQIGYRERPPASGPHYPVPAASGVYPQGLDTGYWVHSLEHGYIVLAYKPPVSHARLLQFHEMVKDFPASKFGNVKLVVVPYPGMSRPFAALSWDWRMWMDGFNRAQVLDFYRQHVDRGREDLP